MEPLAFTIPEFCRLHSISRGHFYNLAADGLAPKTMKVGRRVLVSLESAAEWRRDMERPTAKAADAQDDGEAEQ
jgi:predicted DNA-binding transcriptional regulator AlpA